ncbi:MAG: hypothetical protein Q9186_007614 [Xanthomendoza sp. 1 TL-2023]
MFSAKKSAEKEHERGNHLTCKHPGECTAKIDGHVQGTPEWCEHSVLLFNPGYHYLEKKAKMIAIKVASWVLETSIDLNITYLARYCFLPNGEETAVSSSTKEATAPASITEAPSLSTPAANADAQTTAVTDCHMHETAQFCIKGNSEEVMAMVTGSIGPTPPASYTGCHSHGDELFCFGPDQEETMFAAEAAAAASPTGAASSEQSSGSTGGRNCHFHAGVEHCLEPGETEGGSASKSAAACNKVDRSYNMDIRIGTLFVMLVTSSIGVFGPILLVRFAHVHPSGILFTVIKQFGTGIIISTAFIHLLTHAELMFGNECLGELKYEATTTAIAVAGAFLTFLLQYISIRFYTTRSKIVKSAAGPVESANGDSSDKSSQTHVPMMQDHMPKLDDPLSVLILEMGIIFHSAIIGVTLVVAGDSFYKILVVGLALGARISNLSTVSLGKKLLMGSAFALITPLGMAIGLGVLNSFNGNDKATIVAIGTLDAFSAGILIWAGLIQMWAFDWLYGDLKEAGLVQTCLGMFSLVSGLVVMSVLGKWA